ncbi:hypothetical protein NDR87_31445 [Nocardia sp. CDC159]|uniref:Uncharacterized protein n=1 Tax=Nocardia pulmonis TaxID=2951408 RepID=A0A9X2ECM2_9NOCA|nr:MULTISPECIES: hypothetical protein [Nocardia]MCM6777935.1 hypothetical protein [Nocardia pulmonis]MCM6790894.1 hypothetical protein [Nocardia sp. CDC159]
MPDQVATIVGLTVTRLRAQFDPTQDVPPLGGGTDRVHILAGEVVVPPPWVGFSDDSSASCEGCGPYLWVRLVRRWRTGDFPAEAATGSCMDRRACTIEAGIARCHPFEAAPAALEQAAAVQWDDSWRIDAALCAALRDAEDAGAATDSALGPGEPYGPEGLVLAWTQVAHAQL